MKPLTRRLLNDFQSDFPLSPKPFTRIAGELHTSTDTVLDQLKSLQLNGVVSRVGPVFRPNTIGASTLAAMAVPAHELEQVAMAVNSFEQVNHNYEREHRFNLWFVVTAASPAEIEHTLDAIRERTGHDVMSLPLLRDYHIDLGFRMQLEQLAEPLQQQTAPDDTGTVASPPIAAGSTEDLIQAIQAGLPLVRRPYREIGMRIGCSEDEVIGQLRSLIDSGTIKRLGVVVRHHELGYRANAMVVWDIPDQQVDRLGRQMGDQDCVTLCYQRPRRLPHWLYNLFCMVHGRDRDDVLACIDHVAAALDIDDLPHEVLFSGRRFRQRGARYRV